MECTLRLRLPGSVLNASQCRERGRGRGRSIAEVSTRSKKAAENFIATRSDCVARRGRDAAGLTDASMCEVVRSIAGSRQNGRMAECEFEVAG